MEVADVVLSDVEIYRITGYRQHLKQLDELKRQGYFRARLDRLGRVIVERAHYDAVCSGQTFVGGARQRPEPKLASER